MPEIQGNIGQEPQQRPGIGAVNLPSDLFAAEQSGQRRLAGAVQQVGATASDISTRLLKLQQTEQANSAQQEYEAAKRDFTLELEKDTDYPSHKAKFDTWHEKTSGEILEKVSNNAAKAKVEDFLGLHGSRDGLTVELRAWDNHKREIEESIPDQIDSHIVNILSKDDPITALLDKDGVERAEALSAMDEYINDLHEAGLLDGKGHEFWKRESQKRLEEAQDKYNDELAEQFINDQVIAIAQLEGWDAALAWIDDPGTLKQLSTDLKMSIEDITSLTNAIKGKAQRTKLVADEKLEAQRETDRGKIYDVIESGIVTLPDGTESTDVRKFIESSFLSEDEQEAMWQKSIKETERRLSGSDITTDSRVRSQFYKEIPLMLSGAVSRDELLDRANNARFGEMVDGELTEPTLDDPDYKSVVNAINAQYEQGYGQMMSRVNNYAEGILLKTDSLGFVANAPVRYKQLGEFQQAWFDLVAAKGADLKISDIYPEGRRLAATFQMTDTEAGRREDVFNLELGQQELEKIPLGKRDDVRKGELGILQRPDGGTSTEISVTTQLDDGDWVNIPALVVGQTNVKGLLAGEEVTEKQTDIAVKRALKREKAGGNLPRYSSVEAAVAIARNRKTEDKAPYNRAKAKPKKLTPKIARRYLDMTGNDREEAMRLAAEDGYTE